MKVCKECKNFQYHATMIKKDQTNGRCICKLPFYLLNEALNRSVNAFDLKADECDCFEATPVHRERVVSVTS